MSDLGDNFMSNQAEMTSSLSSELVLFKENLIRDISLLNKNFDLTSMPSNYMRKRSKIEEIIYQAVFNQNTHKSPFSSFKIANDCLKDLNNIDIVTGTNNLKKVMKSLYADSEQISIMVHKIGSTWLLDEFDLDALFIGHHHYADWNWLREFIERDGLHLAKQDRSRASLTMRDLYAKFLYHSVNQLSIQLPETVERTCSEIDNIQPLPISNATPDANLRTNMSSSDNHYDHQREDFINLVDWKLNDLSLVVGSDLSIFGTKTHPCISLRLHPSQEPINILTGIDMWLENLLNEVPEVAMCYHDQGIVMREYEIFRTEDIPQISGFNKDEVESIAMNLSHFLSINATKEGHTYWLFKEADSTMVKLYDLTDIWMKNHHEVDRNNRHVPDCNPFILPVAVLCYKMAENRINQWHRARNKRGPSNLSSSQFNQEMLENKLADDIYFFNDIFRLLKNCINLLIRTDKNQDLVNKAIILMCQLYLEVDQTTLNNLHYQKEPNSTDIVKFDLSDLKSVEKMPNSQQVSSTLSDPDRSYDDSALIGSQLYKLCIENSTEELFVRTLSILETCQVDNTLNFTDQEQLIRSTLLSDSVDSSGSEVGTVATKKTINEFLIGSAVHRYEAQSLPTDISTARDEEMKVVLKCGLMVELLDSELWSSSPTLNRDVKLYYNIVNSFIRLHESMGHQDTGITDQLLDKMDRKIIQDCCAKRALKIVDVTSFFRAAFMPEGKRNRLAMDDRLHKSWYHVIQFLLLLANELLKVSLSKSERVLVQTEISVLVNLLVGATVNLYKLESSRTNCQPDKAADIRQWCKDNVLPNIAMIAEWTSMADFSTNVEATLKALVWTNKAKLLRFCGVVLDDIDYFYKAIESNSTAIETLVYTNKKKLPPICTGIKCDRLELCCQLLEKVYNSLKGPEEFDPSVERMNSALELSEKIYRLESVHHSCVPLRDRLTSLRLRMNYVRYYLNFKTGKSLNYEQIVNDFQNDLRQIQAEEDSVSKCKESLLIIFFLTKIESDRLEILSTLSMENFLRENTKILGDIMSVKSCREYLETEGEVKLKEIHAILLNMLKKLHKKYRVECQRKKKVHRNPKMLQELERYLSRSRSCGSVFGELKDLVKEVRAFI